MGLEIRSAAARAVFRQAGALVDDETQMVRIGGDIVRHFAAQAPERFVLHARNPERDLHVGGDVVNFGPVNGAPHVADREGGRRYGDIEAFRDILKITQALGILHWQGGVVVEPVDLPVPTRHLDMYQAHIELSDIVWAARGVGGVAGRRRGSRCARSSTAHARGARRAAEPDDRHQRQFAAPGRRGDPRHHHGHGRARPVRGGHALHADGRHGAGDACRARWRSRPPRRSASSRLTQMIRPGAPAVLGGFTSNVDMRTGSPAFGTPEYVHATLGGAQIARRLKIPFRSSAVNASPAVDAQATYETGFSLWASIMSHSHLINHAAGWLEGGLTASFEKIVVDAEMLRELGGDAAVPRIQRRRRSALEAIRGVAPGGNFFEAQHTLARYRTAFYRPLLSDWTQFRELAGRRRARRHRAGHRSLEAAARRLCRRRRSTPAMRDAVARLRGAPQARLLPARPRMTRLITNARMYAVTPEAEEAWRGLLGHSPRRRAWTSLMPYPAPQPLERAVAPARSRLRLHVRLSRSPWNCAESCRSRRRSRAPPGPAGRAALPLRPDRARRRPFRRSKTHSAAPSAGRSTIPIRASTRSAIICWLTAAARRLSSGGRWATSSPRADLDGVRDGSIDVGPLDAYWHMLIRKHRPEL